MAIFDFICAAIREHKFLLIKFTEEGIEYTNYIEPYKLGFDHSDELVLGGYHLVSHPGLAFFKGSRNYLVEQISFAEIQEECFSRPGNEAAAGDTSQFKQVICDLEFPD